MKTIGEKIRELREQKGWSQRELAELMCVKKQTVSYIEANKSSVKSDYVYVLCDIFECDANELFGYEKFDD